ncbi:MAG TPA: hypothetical protein GX743_01085, partial [Actinomycetales bacterium]|nr:hypothetical protein [Actinomycetales bacterium]
EAPGGEAPGSGAPAGGEPAQDAESERQDPGTASPVRAPRGGRRRVVAKAQAPEEDSDAPPAIIALPAQIGDRAEGKSLLPTSILDTIVFPERGEEPRTERKKSRRVVASGAAVPPADESAPAAGEPGSAGEETPAPAFDESDVRDNTGE